MAAMNISLSDDLRARMDSVSGVTWSQVAAKAFELEVNSKTMGKDNDMTAAIKRLRASRQKAEQEDKAQAWMKARSGQWSTPTGLTSMQSRRWRVIRTTTSRKL